MPATQAREAEFKLAGSTITYRKAPIDQMLREIASIGYAGSPTGYREGASAEQTKALYGSYGLLSAPGYLGAKFWDMTESRKILEAARKQADFAQQLGLTELFVAENCFAERFAVAGHVTADRADQVSPDGYRVMAETLNEVGRICQERGVAACFHNHAGSFIETRDEFDKLLALTDPKLVFIGLDTGHLAYGGGDVVDFTRAYAPRFRALHLKDVHANILDQARREKLTYHQAQEKGLWAELGEGMVDFPGMFELLRSSGFVGWVVVEIDQTMKATALESLTTCYRYLKSIGL